MSRLSSLSSLFLTSLRPIELVRRSLARSSLCFPRSLLVSSLRSFEGFHGHRSEQSASTGSHFIMYIISVDAFIFYFGVSSRRHRFDEQIGAIPWGEWKMTTLHLDLFLDFYLCVISLIWLPFYWEFHRLELSGKTSSASIALSSLLIARLNFFFYWICDDWCLFCGFFLFIYLNMQFVADFDSDSQAYRVHWCWSL